MSNFFINKIRYFAEKNGNDIAIIYNNEKISYMELIVKVDKIALLIHEKIGKEVRKPIIIYQDRGIDFIIYILAVLKCNCYYVPLELNIPVGRVKEIYYDIQAQMIISDCKKIENLNIFSPKVCMQNFDIQDVKIDDVVNKEDLVYVIYTSGTTGNPKGVKIKYSNLENLLHSLGKILYNKFLSPVNVGVISCFSFDASVKQIFGSLYYGNTLVIADNSVRNFGRKLHNFHNYYNLTVCDGTPSHLKLMIMQKTKEYSKIPYLLIGGENLTWNLLWQYKNKYMYMPKIINVYGPTECCVDVSYNIIDELKKTSIGNVSIGKPLENTILKIIDESGATVTEKNCIGELCVIGRQVGAGYVNIDSEAFVKDETGENIMYKTGDLAKYDNNGEIIIISRKDKQVKINGYRIELGEITSLLEEITKKQCVVLCMEEKEQKYLVAFMNDYESNEKLLDLLEEKLPIYMVPNKFFNVEKIPLTVNGKIDEKKLIKMYIGEEY